MILYRIRCYIASLQGTELPNPQVSVNSNQTVSSYPLLCVSFIVSAWVYFQAYQDGFGKNRHCHCRFSSCNSKSIFGGGNVLHLPTATKQFVCVYF